MQIGIELVGDDHGSGGEKWWGSYERVDVKGHSCIYGIPRNANKVLKYNTVDKLRHSSAMIWAKERKNIRVDLSEVMGASMTPLGMPLESSILIPKTTVLS